MRPHFALVSLCFSLAIAPAGSLAANDQLDSLRKVWQTIQDFHWDRDLIEEKWTPILPEFEERIKATETDGEAVAVIQSMIDRLGQSHFAIIPSTVYDRQKELGIQKGSGSLGIQVRLINDELIVTRIADDSSASKAGISVGDRLDKIRSKPAGEIIEKASEQSKYKAGRAETFVGLLAEAMLGGSVGDSVALEWTDREGQLHQSELELQPSKGQFAEFGNLPAVEVVIETEVLPGNIVLYRFSSFFNPVPLIGEMKTLMEKHSDAEGLILDVRGNRGGIVLMVCGLCNWLSDEKSTIGIMRSSQSELKLKLNPRKPTFHGKVVVLTDELSISSAEILAGGLQDASLATVIGTTSAGLVLPSIVSTLPNGDRFQYAISDFETGDGRRLEGDGVVPDIIVQPTRESLQKQVDPALERALKWILQDG
ncbi:MAG: S41 family peptidase [Planctomycetota bacterium]